MVFPLLRRLNCRCFKQHFLYLQASAIANNVSYCKSTNYYVAPSSKFMSQFRKKSSNLLLEITPVTTIKSAKMSATAGSKIKTVTFDDVKVLKMKENVYLIDVREPRELQETGIIPDAINIPVKELEKTLKSMENKDFIKQFGRPKPELDTPLIFSCQLGKRSTEASEIALKLGYKNINNYTGGYADWEKKMK